MKTSMGGAMAEVCLSVADCRILAEACGVAAGEAPAVFSEALYCQLEALAGMFGRLAGVAIGADLDAAPSGQVGGDRAL